MKFKIPYLSRLLEIKEYQLEMELIRTAMSLLNLEILDKEKIFIETVESGLDRLKEIAKI